MAIYTRSLNSVTSTLNQASDITSVETYLTSGWVLFSDKVTKPEFLISANTLGAGRCIIRVSANVSSQPANQDHYVLVISNANETINTSWDKKVGIKIAQTAVDNAANVTNNLGLWVAEVFSEATRPTEPHIKLREVTAGDTGTALDFRETLAINSDVIPAGAIDFLDLWDTTDFANTYVGKAGEFVVVNGSETGLDSIPASSVTNPQKSFVLGEDFSSAWSGEGSGFIGKWETVYQNVGVTAQQSFGAAAGNEKIRLKFNKTISQTVVSQAVSWQDRTFWSTTNPKVWQSLTVVENTITWFAVNVRHQWSAVTDDVVCTIYDTPSWTIIAESDNVLLWASIWPTFVSPFEFTFSGVDLSCYDEIFMEFSRTWPLVGWGSGQVLTIQSSGDTNPYGGGSIWQQNASFIYFNVPLRDFVFTANFATVLPTKNYVWFDITIAKQWAPVDDINVDFQEGVTSLPTDNSLNITNAEVIGSSITKLTGRGWFTNESDPIYIEFDRVGAVDPVNYYLINTDTTVIVPGVTWEVFDGVSRTQLPWLPVFSSTFWFEADKMYLSDTRSDEANISDGIIQLVWLEWESRNFTLWGLVPNTETPGSNIYLDGVSLWSYSAALPSTNRPFIIGRQKTSDTLFLNIDEQNFELYDYKTIELGQTSISLVSIRTNEEEKAVVSFTAPENGFLLVRATNIARLGNGTNAFGQVRVNDQIARVQTQTIAAGGTRVDNWNMVVPMRKGCTYGIEVFVFRNGTTDFAQAQATFSKYIIS